jgi:hypothetical protein
LQQLDHCAGACGCAHLSFVDEVDEHVARTQLSGVLRIDHGQVGRRVAGRPFLRAYRPSAESVGLVTGLDIVVTRLQARIDEVGGKVRDRRVACMVRIDSRHSELPEQTNEGRRFEAVVANLYNMPERMAVHVPRQQFKKGGEIRLLELLRWCELPKQRP